MNANDGWEKDGNGIILELWARVYRDHTMGGGSSAKDGPYIVRSNGSVKNVAVASGC